MPLTPVSTSVPAADEPTISQTPTDPDAEPGTAQVLLLPRVSAAGDEPTSEELLARAADLDGEERRALQQRVVHDNLELARRLAARYRGRGEPQDDLEQVANMGLVLAVLRYDPSHGVSLADFATPTIVGELRKHFRDRCWTVRPPRRLQELRPELRRVELELEQTLHRAATTTEIAGAMGLSLAEVAEVERAATGYAPVSLEHPSGLDGSAMTLGDSIADDVDELDRLLTRMSVHTMLDSLTARQRRILELRFFSEMTQQQIADEIGVSQVQVSRLLSQILSRLRASLDVEGLVSTPA